MVSVETSVDQPEQRPAKFCRGTAPAFADADGDTVGEELQRAIAIR
jgi:hypothetical protein